jgi:hypothetical protein
VTRTLFLDSLDIIEAMQVSVFVLEVGEDGLPRYVTLNKVGMEWTGLTLERVIGKTALEIYGSEAGERALSIHLGVIEAGEPASYDVSIPFAQKVGHLRSTLTPFKDENGKVTHLLGSSLDVTSEKERDAALELTKLAKEKAEEAGRAKEQFLANMSHEIRTPMNGIMGMCELLRETKLTSRQSLYADTIFNSSNALLDIINDVLDFSKISAEKLSLQNAPFSMRALVKDTCTLLRTGADIKDVTLTCHCDPAMPEEFVGDYGRMRQILMNLIGNAIKFTDKGWVDVSVEYGVPGAEFPMKISVTDTGEGIAPADQEKIFSAFEQVENATVQREDGTGLGLAISRALIEQMGGEITLESRLDHGTTFSVLLNLPKVTPSGLVQHEITPAEIAPTSNPVGTSVKVVTPPDLSGMKILLVEDNSTNRLVAQKMLRQTGVNVRVAENGVEAVEAYKEDAFDVVLMDLSMPVMGGLEATRMIREHEKDAGRQEGKIIALTANAQPKDKQDCLNAGMNDFLSKPFRKGILFSMLQEVSAADLATASQGG